MHGVLLKAGGQYGSIYTRYVFLQLSNVAHFSREIYCDVAATLRFFLQRENVIDINLINWLS